MKKLVLIVSLIFVAASCQKENIVPNPNGCHHSQDDRVLKSNTVDPNDDDTRGGTVQTISNDGTTVTGGTTSDPSTTSGDDGTITDPMKKKDRKNN